MGRAVRRLARDLAPGLSPAGARCVAALLAAFLAALLVAAPTPAPAQLGWPPSLEPPPWKPKRPELVGWRAVKSIDGTFRFAGATGAPTSALVKGKGGASGSGTASLKRQPLDPWQPERVVFTGPIRGTVSVDEAVGFVEGGRESGKCSGPIAGQEDGKSYLSVALDLDEGTFTIDLTGGVEDCGPAKLHLAQQEVEIGGGGAGFQVFSEKPVTLTPPGVQLRATAGAYLVAGVGLPLTGTGTVTLALGGGPVEGEVQLAGCSDLAEGQSDTVTATAQPEGGRFRFWTEPAGKLSVSASEGVATLSCASPGRTTLHVEYALGAKKKKASQQASCVRVDSVNGGAAIPKLGLYDADGQKSSPPRVVPVKTTPPGAASSLVTFEADDPAVANAASVGGQLQL